jgi:uncharacterized protein involved in tolerance to divalent cations|nr:MAG TPA: hypothetical protein [Caudoviricetes sp.]
MKLDYDGFMMYASMHNEDITKDIVKTMGDSWNEEITLSEADLALVAKISVLSVKAVLRQYHEWVNSQT